MDDSVVIATPCMHEVGTYYFHSILGLIAHENATNSKHMTHPNGGLTTHVSTRLPVARNLLVRNFLDTKANWLWFIDSDMVFRKDTLSRLLAAAYEHNSGIMGGLCFAVSMDGFPWPTLINRDDKNEQSIQYDYPKDTVVEVDVTGAACLLIHRTVLESMREVFSYNYPFEWFQDTKIGTAEVGEDVAFCVRARQLGFKVYVHTGIKIGHLKPIIVDETLFERLEPYRSPEPRDDSAKAIIHNYIYSEDKTEES